jgi:hypothetical protein
VRADAVLSHSLIGLNVYKAADEKVGEIKDPLIAKDMPDGYILSVGGFIGAGKHFVAATPQSISVTYDPAKKKWMALIKAE